MRVMYAECSGPVWRGIARRLGSRHDWRPVYWLAAPEDAGPVTSEFPDAQFHSGVEAARDIPASGADWPLPALDSALLEALAPYESITLHMMDRMDPDGHSFPYDERRRHYHDLLRYWLGVLDRFAPDLVMFSIAPHIVYDYVLYALCRHRGVPTVMFERIGLPGYVYPVAEIDAYPPRLQPARGAVRETAAKPALSPSFEAYLAAQSAGGEKAMPANFEKKLKRYGLARAGRDGFQVRLAAELWFEFKRAAYLFRKNGFAPVPRTYVKLRGQRPADSHPTTWDLEVRRVRAILTKRRLRRLVHRLAARPVRDEPHVLLALHYQPERATVPMGGMLGDQALIADILAKSLPEGWWLYVKEHPWQLQGFSRGEMQRSEDFYRRLAALPQHSPDAVVRRYQRADRQRPGRRHAHRVGRLAGDMPRGSGPGLRVGLVPGMRRGVPSPLRLGLQGRSGRGRGRLPGGGLRPARVARGRAGGLCPRIPGAGRRVRRGSRCPGRGRGHGRCAGSIRR